MIRISGLALLSGALTGFFGYMALIPGNRAARFMLPGFTAMAFLALEIFKPSGGHAVVTYGPVVSAVLMLVLTARRPMSWSGEIREICGESDFEAFVHETDGRAIIDFYAQWCMPCRALAPVVNALAREGKRVAVVELDANRELAARYEVQAVPTLLIVEAGKIVGRSTGLHTKHGLTKLLAGN